MAPPDVVDEFRRYVMNEIPIRLIDVNTLKLVDRGFVRRHFEKDIDNITDDTVDDRWDRPRAENIQVIIKESVTYAILSHRWLDEGEPTHKEMMESEPRSWRGPGYEKLKKFCAEARYRGFKFAWSDTCCIDKTSSVELDESLRSMFRWYQNSTLCIIHLAQSTSPDDLKRDEWLERGWTLQELLAPANIMFFNDAWGPLADYKEVRSLRSVITKATGIPDNDIGGFTPTSWRVDEVMTWAAKRKTTRVEDAAYSLMGILDVSMQIAYGEGAERAFRRLIEAIMLNAGSPTVLNFTLSHKGWPALPLSPMDYVGHPRLGHKGGGGLLDMALTGRGLRVPLIVLPVEIVDGRQAQDSSWTNIRLRCPRYGIADIFASVPPVNIPSSRSEEAEDELALGIFTYFAADDGHPSIPGNTTGYLLMRQKVERHADSGSFEGYRDTSSTDESDSKWSRVQTKEHVAVVLHPPIPSGARRSIDRRNLKIVYL